MRVDSFATKIVTVYVASYTPLGITRCNFDIFGCFLQNNVIDFLSQRLLGIQMATFKLHLICRWSPDDFELYIQGPDDSDVETN